MEMEFSVSKRKRESSTSIQPNSRMATKLTMRKLDFSASEAFSSPVHVDDNSCGANWDHSDNSMNESSFVGEIPSDIFASPVGTPIFATANTRRRSSQGSLALNAASSAQKPATARRLLKEKSKSDSFFGSQDEDLSSHDAIMRALETCAEHSASHHHDDAERLVGDLSRKHTLPILKVSKHRDLASISADTLVDLIAGKYSDQISEYTILDARYPYEFAGGHITGAENAYVKDELYERLFRDAQLTDKPKVLIIHCEFSSERGPKLMREIRERDRMLNHYPNLFFPEMYLLEGGYKQFYESFSHLCSPQGYLPMLHDNHRNELKYFRRKSKTWEQETRRQRNNSSAMKTKLSF